MRRSLPTLVWWLWVVGGLHGQVEVEVLLQQSQFLADESLPLAVRIVNRSGQRLALGRQNNWLVFTVESREGVPVRKRADPPVAGEFSVESSASATKVLDLMPYYALSTPGRYRLRAAVRVPDWDQVFASAPVEFDIGRGTTIWEQEFGVPASEGPPEVRKYALQQANYYKRPMLYLRLTDGREVRVFQVLPLGPLVSFSHPEHLIDRESQLHVLFQTGARSFNYCVINPDGQWVKRQTYQYFRTRPGLHSNEGEVLVRGGIRRERRDDIPPPEPGTKRQDGNVPTP